MHRWGLSEFDCICQRWLSNITSSQMVFIRIIEEMLKKYVPNTPGTRIKKSCSEYFVLFLGAHKQNITWVLFNCNYCQIIKMNVICKCSIHIFIGMPAGLPIPMEQRSEITLQSLLMNIKICQKSWDKCFSLYIRILCTHQNFPIRKILWFIAPIDYSAAIRSIWHSYCMHTFASWRRPTLIGASNAAISSIRW